MESKLKTDKGSMKEKLVAKFHKLKREAESQGVDKDTLRSVFLNATTIDKVNAKDKPNGEDKLKYEISPNGEDKGNDSNKHNGEEKQKAENGHKVRELGSIGNKTSKPTPCMRTGSILQIFRRNNKQQNTKHGKKSFLACMSIVFLVLGILSSVGVYLYRDTALIYLDDFFELSLFPCTIENNAFVIEIARPKVSCDICRTLNEVPIEETITPEDFIRKYAYTSVPVLIKNATTDWTAMETFSYDYFKTLYTQTEGALEAVEEQCQFFPYKTEFETLADVFNISEDRVKFKEGEKPWYIGWSNCHAEVKDKLRTHYQRPYFLPSGSESSGLDWMFMGGSGLGAFIHLDYVQRPSWQAQISGRKTWTLVPVPECESVCHTMNVTVHKGDIFVIDTNQWYHATYIHPGEISITIGSEYD